MAVNLKAMELPALLELQTSLTAEILDKQNQARASFVDEMRQLAASRGLQLSEFVDIKRGKVARARSSSSEIKYRDPDNPANVWSGRGRLARWLQEKVDAGRNKEDFRVQAEAVEALSADEPPKRSRKKEANA